MAKVQNSLIKEDVKETISTFLTKPAIKARINEMMSGKDGNQFITSIVAAVNQSTKLLECDPKSIFITAMQGASLRLNPSPVLGHFYMVPFKKKGIPMASFILGYKGYIQLAIRSAQYRDIGAFEIKESELLISDPFKGVHTFKIIEDEEVRATTKTMGYYCYFELLNGFRKEVYWSKKKMELHADKYAPTFKLADYKLLQAGKIDPEDLWRYDAQWYKNFDNQGCKTVIRNLLSKWGILSIDMVSALEQDYESEKKIDEEKKEPVNITNNDDPFEAV